MDAIVAELNKEMSPLEICKDPNEPAKEIPFEKFSDLMKYLFTVPFERITET